MSIKSVPGARSLGGERHDEKTLRRWFERLGRVLPNLLGVFAQWDGTATLLTATMLRVGRKGLLFSADTPKVRLRQRSNFQFWVLSFAYPMERTQNQKRSLGNALSVLIYCLLFGRETHASTTQSDPLLLPTRNGPCREDGASAISCFVHGNTFTGRLVMPTPAYRHDHSPEQEKRRITIDGKEYVYPDQLAWPGIATLPGLPSTAIPTGFALDGRSACRSSGPGWRTRRR